MRVYIVFEYGEYISKVIGVFDSREKAVEEHKKSPTWRYIEEHEVQ